MDIGQYGYRSNTDIDVIRTPTPYCQRKLITDALKYQPVGMDIGVIRISGNTDIATVYVSLSRRALYGIVARNSCTDTE